MKRENGKKELQSQVHLSWWYFEMLYVAWTNFTGPSACGFKEVTRTIIRLVAIGFDKLKAQSTNKPQRQLQDWLWLDGKLARTRAKESQRRKVEKK